jgi:hypothetical protein
VKCIHKNVPPVVHEDVFRRCYHWTRWLIEEAEAKIFRIHRFSEKPFCGIWRNEIGDLPGNKLVANVIDSQSRMEIAAIYSVVSVLEGRMSMRLMQVVRGKLVVYFTEKSGETILIGVLP